MSRPKSCTCEHYKAKEPHEYTCNMNINQHAKVKEPNNMRSLENATARPWKLDDLTVINRELLAALSEYIAEWEANHAHEDNKTGYTKEPNSLILAREAIARAEGRS